MRRIRRERNIGKRGGRKMGRIGRNDRSEDGMKNRGEREGETRRGL